MNRYIVRILQPTGMYPAEPLGFVGFAAIAAEDIAWSVVFDPVESDRVFADEVHWLRPSEVRFLAAVSLAEANPRMRGRIQVHSGPEVGFLELSDEDAGDPHRFLEASQQFVIQRVENIDSYSFSSSGDETWHPVERDYHDDAEALIDAMDFSDPLLHRGLAKFLAATELAYHPKFLEEAGLSAFISREAALELLRRKLSTRSEQRANRADVFAWIEEEFPTGGAFVRVLERDWEARVTMVHPVSEHGEFWSPPVFAEECYDAIHTLTHLYRFLLLDEPWIPIKRD